MKKIMTLIVAATCIIPTFSFAQNSRAWGTYYGNTSGGPATDFGRACAADASGNVYLLGETTSLGNGMIATPGCHQGVIGSITTFDLFLVKFNGSGVRQWGTFYGGTGDERCNGNGNTCTVDASGNVYIAGYSTTTTGTSVATAGSHQSTWAGGFDAFLVKFNSSGVRQWGTYYGGTGSDIANAVAVDASGNVYLAGQTTTSTGTAIATAGSYQPAFGTGTNDAFLVKFNSSGVRQWGTYYGSTGNDIAVSCSADASGNVYLTGSTTSPTSTAIATVGSSQSALAGGTDAFLVKFNSSGVRQWGTYYGSAGTDYTNACAADAAGNVYISGSTTSSTSTAIATSGSHQSAFGGVQDAFLVKFNSSGVRQWGTYYGGTAVDLAYSCATNSSGYVFISGEASSTSGISTTGCWQPSDNGFQDGFMAVFDANGIRQTATYYGAGGSEFGMSSATDPLGNVFLAGTTGTPNSGTIIASAGAHQTTGGGNDAYLAKFSDFLLLPIELFRFDAICNSSKVEITWSTASEVNNDYFTVERSSDAKIFDPIGIVDGAGNSIQQLNYSFDDHESLNGICYYRLKQTDYDGSFSYSEIISVECGADDDLSINIYPNPAFETINISTSGNSFLSSEPYLTIVDVLGRTIFQQEIVTENTFLNLNNRCNKGVYFLLITDRAGVVLYTHKIVFQ